MKPTLKDLLRLIHLWIEKSRKCLDFFFYYKVEHSHAFCLDISIRGKAAFAAANAPSTMASGPPTKVYTWWAHHIFSRIPKLPMYEFVHKTEFVYQYLVQLIIPIGMFTNTNLEFCKKLFVFTFEYILTRSQLRSKYNKNASIQGVLCLRCFSRLRKNSVSRKPCKQRSDLVLNGQMRVPK